LSSAMSELATFAKGSTKVELPDVKNDLFTPPDMEPLLKPMEAAKLLAAGLKTEMAEAKRETREAAKESKAHALEMYKVKKAAEDYVIAFNGGSEASGFVVAMAKQFKDLAENERVATNYQVDFVTSIRQQAMESLNTAQADESRKRAITGIVGEMKNLTEEQKRHAIALLTGRQAALNFGQTMKQALSGLPQAIMGAIQGGGSVGGAIGGLFGSSVLGEAPSSPRI